MHLIVSWNYYHINSDTMSLQQLCCASNPNPNLCILSSECRKIVDFKNHNTEALTLPNGNKFANYRNYQPVQILTSVLSL